MSATGLTDADISNVLDSNERCNGCCVGARKSNDNVQRQELSKRQDGEEKRLAPIGRNIDWRIDRPNRCW